MREGPQKQGRATKSEQISPPRAWRNPRCFRGSVPVPVVTSKVRVGLNESSPFCPKTRCPCPGSGVYLGNAGRVKARFSRGFLLCPSPAPHSWVLLPHLSRVFCSFPTRDLLFGASLLLLEESLAREKPAGQSQLLFRG